MKRVAYIGLSSPLFYDHSVREYNKGFAHPILESPFGLLAFYDELVFFSKEQCPANMRNLPFVTFLADTVTSENWKKLLNNLNIEDIAVEIFKPSFDFAQFVNYQFGSNWPYTLTTDGNFVTVGGINFPRKSDDNRNIVFDTFINERLSLVYKTEVDLVTNSISNVWNTKGQKNLMKARVTENFIFHNLPNYVSSIGPYHESFEEIRNNKYISEFRVWISENKKIYTAKQAKEFSIEIQNQIDIYTKEIFLKSIDPKHCYYGAGKQILGAFVDLFLPFASTLTGVSNDIEDARKRKQSRWKGFVQTIDKKK